MFRVPNKYRKEKAGVLSSDSSFGNNGVFVIPGMNNMDLMCIASDGQGWEHVSVSLKNRCPNWPEMCQVKDLFWGEEDCVIQFHPPKSEYVNCHPNCLHLWRPTNKKILRPPSLLVGPK